jgi:hypothetical protein
VITTDTKDRITYHQRRWRDADRLVTTGRARSAARSRVSIVNEARVCRWRIRLRERCVKAWLSALQITPS